MPGYDGQGPVWGGGPGAGWGAGPCGAGGRRGFGRGYGRGGGRGFGRGFGFRRFAGADPYYEDAPRTWTKKDELSALDEEEKMLKEDLAEIAKARKGLSSQK